MMHRLVAAGLLPVLQVAALAALIVFVTTYMVRVPSWHRTPEGRYLVVSKLAFLILLGLGGVAALWPGWVHWAGRDYVRAGAYLVLLAVFVWLNVVAHQAWRRGRAHDQQVSGGMDESRVDHPDQR